MFKAGAEPSLTRRASSDHWVAWFRPFTSSNVDSMVQTWRSLVMSESGIWVEQKVCSEAGEGIYRGLCVQRCEVRWVSKWPVVCAMFLGISSLGGSFPTVRATAMGEHSERTTSRGSEGFSLLGISKLSTGLT